MLNNDHYLLRDEPGYREEQDEEETPAISPANFSRMWDELRKAQQDETDRLWREHGTVSK